MVSSLNLLGEDAKGAGAARGVAPRVDRTMAGGVLWLPVVAWGWGVQTPRFGLLPQARAAHSRTCRDTRAARATSRNAAAHRRPAVALLGRFFLGAPPEACAIHASILSRARRDARSRTTALRASRVL